ncbi:MAG: helix-turn-helix domain-containing protein [Acidimicrobiales bacterium]
MLAVTAGTWGLSVHEVTSASRRAQLVAARHAAVYLARELLGLSWAELAALVGRWDHSTAVSSHARALVLLEADPGFAERVSWARAMLGGTQP